MAFLSRHSSPHTHAKPTKPAKGAVKTDKGDKTSEAGKSDKSDKSLVAANTSLAAGTANAQSSTKPNDNLSSVSGGSSNIAASNRRRKS